MSILLEFPAARRHRVPPPCRSAQRGGGQTLPLWITWPGTPACGQLFAIRAVMREDAPSRRRAAGGCRLAEGVGGGGGGLLFGGWGEGEEVQVLLDAFGADGLGDDDDADLEVPAQDDLGGGHAVLGGDLGQRAVAQPGALEGAVALHRYAASGMRGQQAGVVTGRAPRDLVDG